MTDNPNPNSFDLTPPTKIKIPNWIVTLFFCLISIISYHFLVKEPFFFKKEQKQKLNLQEIQTLKKQTKNLEEEMARLRLNYQKTLKVSENSPDLMALKHQIETLSNEKHFLTLFKIIKNRILKGEIFDKEYILLEKVVKEKNIDLKNIKNITKIKNKKNLIHTLGLIVQEESCSSVFIKQEGFLWDYLNKFFQLIHLRSTEDHTILFKQALSVLKKRSLKESITIINSIIDSVKRDVLKNKITEWLKDANETLYVEEFLFKIQEKLEQDFLERFKD